jgi:hypothetical protein
LGYLKKTAQQNFSAVDPFGLTTVMSKLYTLFSLAPAPLFLLGMIYSLVNPPALCSSFPYEMTLMWFVMLLAHLTPWLLFYSQHFARD